MAKKYLQLFFQLRCKFKHYLVLRKKKHFQVAFQKLLLAHERISLPNRSILMIPTYMLQANSLTLPNRA